jgi:chromosome segregation ATPase
MRDQDKDLDLPNFGPAEREPEIKASGNAPASEPKSAPPTGGQSQSGSGGNRQPSDPVQKSGSGGNGLSFFIILLLAASVGGLAYWNYLQHEQLLSLESERQGIDEKVLELQQLLQVAESSAAQSGETLQSQVQKQASTAQQKFTKLGSDTTKLNAEVDKLNAEIAKLWVVAHQRNTPKIAALEKQLKEAKALTGTQAKALKSLTTDLVKLGKQVKSAEAKGSDAIKQVAAIKQSAATLSTEFQILSETIETDQLEQRKKLSAFAEQIVALQGNQNSAVGLERRVKINEQAVKAIDGSRLMLNKELLQIRQKLNNLQLKIEQL